MLGAVAACAWRFMLAVKRRIDKTRRTARNVGMIMTGHTAHRSSVRRMKVAMNCYEAYVVKDGKRQELFLDPVSGKVVETRDN